MSVGRIRHAGDCPQPGCVMAAGHTEACRELRGGVAEVLVQREPEVDSRDEELAELRRRCSLYAGQVRRLLGVVRDVERNGERMR